MNLALVCVGAGSGERFGGDKLSQLIAGQTVFARSVSALSSAFPETTLVVVTAEDRLDEWRIHLEPQFPGVTLVAGGARRQDSVRNGVEAAAGQGANVVAVHDAARPLVDPGDVRRVVEGLGNAAGAVLCQRVNDTVKRVAEDGSVVETVPREALRLSLTPQVYRIDALRLAWRQTDPATVWTDEAAQLEALGMEVRAIEALHPNPKLTTAADLIVLRALAGRVS